MSKRLVSIVICTRDGAARLAGTLRSLEAVESPPEARVEVLVVDNGSTDGTPALLREAQLRDPRVRALQVAEKGKSIALNAALEEARGEVLLFTDDDVRVPPDWAARMAAPLLAGRFDAVTGRVALAPGLERPWMTLTHLWWLAVPPDNDDHELVGANMGFHRRVLGRVPRFDAELGPGALGFGEDKLFGLQLAEAGFAAGYLPGAAVVHDLDASRLVRGVWLGEAEKRGRVDAYHAYHWEHHDVRAPRLRAAWFGAKLHLRRLAEPPAASAGEGCAVWEMVYVRELARCRQYLRERRRPRRYARRGLVPRHP